MSIFAPDRLSAASGPITHYDARTGVTRVIHADVCEANSFGHRGPIAMKPSKNPPCLFCGTIVEDHRRRACLSLECQRKEKQRRAAQAAKARAKYAARQK